MFLLCSFLWIPEQGRSNRSLNVEKNFIDIGYAYVPGHVMYQTEQNLYLGIKEWGRPRPSSFLLFISDISLCVEKGQMVGLIGANGNTYNYPQKFLQTAGVGTYLNLADWLNLQVGVGFPFANDYNHNTARFYFSVNSDLDRIIPLRNPEKI